MTGARMTPHDKWTSADIARHTADAMRDDVAEFSGLPRKHRPAHYADLRDGGLMLPERPRWRVWAWFAGAAVLGALIGGMTMPAMPAPYVGPGFETCQGSC